MFNRTVFFREIRKSLFKGRFSQSQVDGINVILNTIKDDYNDLPVSHIAYVFATAHHEVGKKFKPVREGFCRSDSCSRKAVARLKRRGVIRTNYALPRGKYRNSYYGRGYVQLTHLENYQKMSKYVDADLERYPDKALNTHIAAKIMIEGMIRGSFTGKSMKKYLGLREEQSFTAFRKARRVVNGSDKRDLIAGYARTYQEAFIKAKKEYVGTDTDTDTEAVKDKFITEDQTDHMSDSGFDEDLVSAKPVSQSTTLMSTLTAGAATLGNVVLNSFQSVSQENPSITLILTGVTLASLAWIFRERLLKAYNDGV